MQILKVLAKKDAYSVALAVALGLMIQSLLYTVSFSWSSKIVTSDDSTSAFSLTGGDWKTNYLVPVLTFISSVLLLELILQVIVYLFAKPVKKK